MKLLAIALIGIGWFGSTLYSSGKTTQLSEWWSYQTTKPQSCKKGSDTEHQLNFVSKLMSIKEQKPIVLAQADTENALSSKDSEARKIQEALSWVLDKTHDNFTHARADASGKKTLALPNNDPGNTSRSALEEAFHSQPSTVAYPLAYSLEHGTGGTADYKRAARIYLKAAELGDVRAQSRLGLAYMKGHLDLKTDLVLAEKWLTAAAVHNDLNAQYYLGRLLLEDKDTNIVDALVWVAVAGKRGYAPAQNVVKQYWTQLNPRQQDELLSRIRQWKVEDSKLSVA
ncbi:MAG: tetratricopeptide repeat protein [Pseudomonadota bacterium]